MHGAKVKRHGIEFGEPIAPQASVIVYCGGIERLRQNEYLWQPDLLR
jgi:hypothetical protein